MRPQFVTRTRGHVTATSETPDMSNGALGLFPGTYRLVSMTRWDATGESVDVYGPDPLGRTGYDHHGRMWVLLASPKRHGLANAGSTPVTATDRGGLNGVVGYCGSYSVDSATATVIHRVEMAIEPRWIGKLFVRKYEFSGDLLTLSFNDGARHVRTLYQRLSENAPAAAGASSHAGRI